MGRPISRAAAGARSGLRGVNRAAILQQLRRYQPLSRADIARRSGLSEGSVSRIVAELIAENLVLERGAESSTGGRPGTRLMLDPGHLRAIGVEIQTWETRVSLGSLDGKPLETQVFRTPSNPQEVLEAVAERCQPWCASLGPQRLEGIGVAARGVVDNHTGTVEIGNPTSWSGVPIRKILEARLPLPVYVENNVRASALAEYNAGTSELQSSHCLLYLGVGEGIGGGIVLNGALYRGAHMSAGEFGEMVVVPDSVSEPKSVETLASNSALVERYGELSDSPRKQRSGENNARVRTICHLAMQGDPAARQAVCEVARYLGLGIENIVWALDPDTVMIDGPLTEAWPLVLATIKEQLPRDMAGFRNFTIRPGTLGLEAAMVGALLLPFGPLFATGERMVAASAEVQTVSP